MSVHDVVRRRRRLWLGAMVVMGLTAAACKRGPTQPSSPGGLTGTWIGSASDSSGPGEVTWELTQAGATFSGTILVSDTHAGYSGRGSVSGKLSGSSVSFAMRVPAGGFEEPYATCTADVSGDGQVDSSSIRGTYSGSNSCSGAIVSGQLELSRQ